MFAYRFVAALVKYVFQVYKHANRDTVKQVRKDERVPNAITTLFLQERE